MAPFTKAAACWQCGLTVFHCAAFFTLALFSGTQMSRLKIALAMIALGAALTACGGGGSDGRSPTSVPQSSPGSVLASYHVDLQYQRNQFISQENMSLALTGVQDDRCRSNTQCISAGTAKISMEITLPGFAPEKIPLSIEGDRKLNDPVRLRDYEFTLVRLTPSPAKTDESVTAYVASVLIEKVVPPKAD